MITGLLTVATCVALQTKFVEAALGTVHTAATTNSQQQGFFELDGNTANTAPTTVDFDWNTVLADPSSFSTTQLTDALGNEDDRFVLMTNGENEDRNPISDWTWHSKNVTAHARANLQRSYMYCARTEVTISTPTGPTTEVLLSGAPFDTTGAGTIDGFGKVGGANGHTLQKVYLFWGTEVADFNQNDLSSFGVWFFQNQICKNDNGTFSGEHEEDDLFMRLNLNGAGDVSEANLFRWDSGQTDNLIAAGADISTRENECRPLETVSVNIGEEDVQTDCAISSSDGEFIEGGIDMSMLRREINVASATDAAATHAGTLLSEIPCFESFMITSREDQGDSDAALLDFQLGDSCLCSFDIEVECDALDLTDLDADDYFQIDIALTKLDFTGILEVAGVQVCAIDEKSGTPECTGVDTPALANDAPLQQFEDLLDNTQTYTITAVTKRPKSNKLVYLSYCRDGNADGSCTAGETQHNVWIKGQLADCNSFAPTSAPTSAPSEPPTAAPSRSPSSAPTAAPTAAPTNSPTDSPTAVPTDSPSDAPTSAPTESPTPAPTGAPTSSPTPAPTCLTYDCYANATCIEGGVFTGCEDECLDIRCHDKDSCQDTEVICLGPHCNIQCLDRDSCKDMAVFQYFDAKADVSCELESSCSGVQIYESPRRRECSDDTDLFICGDGECDNFVFQCCEDSCDIFCHGHDSCTNSVIKCVGGECNVKCDGYNSCKGMVVHQFEDSEANLFCDDSACHDTTVLRAGMSWSNKWAGAYDPKEVHHTCEDDSSQAKPKKSKHQYPESYDGPECREIICQDYECIDEDFEACGECIHLTCEGSHACYGSSLHCATNGVGDGCMLDCNGHDSCSQMTIYEYNGDEAHVWCADHYSCNPLIGKQKSLAYGECPRDGYPSPDPTEAPIAPYGVPEVEGVDTGDINLDGVQDASTDSSKSAFGYYIALYVVIAMTLLCASALGVRAYLRRHKSQGTEQTEQEQASGQDMML